MRWAGETIHEDADALEDALSIPACRMLLLLELLIQLFILLLHVVSEAVRGGIVEGHGGHSCAEIKDSNTGDCTSKRSCERTNYSDVCTTSLQSSGAFDADAHIMCHARHSLCCLLSCMSWIPWWINEGLKPSTTLCWA